MKNRYIDLIEQTFEFPQEGFEVIDNQLHFNEIPLMDIIEQYGTPLKITYLPKISSQIQKAKRLFNVAMAKADYEGNYLYCYCTKSSHFEFVLNEALKNDIHLETSSAFDLPIIKELAKTDRIHKDNIILCNGFKRDNYIEGIADLLGDGFKNVIPILDNKEELNDLQEGWKGELQIGLRIAAEEEPNAEFYTSRLGIRYNEIIDFYKNVIANNKNVKLKLLHFFINTGVKDTAYYWSELQKNINLYCELKKFCPDLEYLDIGGGFPIRTKLDFNYDYQYMADEIIRQIKSACEQRDVPEPNIITEFGSFTVGESGAVLFSVVGHKQQNDNELWNMIDSSFITTLPDTWGLKQKFILLAINNWDDEYQRVNLGGITCDSDDYYIMESIRNRVFLPKPAPGETQYLGFFHTGAYQESIGGYGGIQHCLIPAPKHVLIDKDEDGKITTRLFAKEQSAKNMMKILGY
ncbi:MAG: arginine decarboxylase [Bacteroidia bacterium]|jgi:arginine decarboxylase|nr:arginine decarboxylase [Bacteroidia bacterium]